jgi:hypothetical protein
MLVAGGADGPARLNSFDVDALSDEQALKNDMVCDYEYSIV